MSPEATHVPPPTGRRPTRYPGPRSTRSTAGSMGRAALPGMPGSGAAQKGCDGGRAKGTRARTAHAEAPADMYRSQTSGRLPQTPDAEPVGRLVDRVVGQVVADGPVDDAPRQARVDGQLVEHRRQAERAGRRESVAQGAAHEWDRPVVGGHRRQVPEPGPGTLDDQVPDIRSPVAVHLRPVQQVPMDRPTRVPVECVAVAIGVPAVAPVPGEHPVDALIDEPVVDGFAEAPADGRHDGREQHPVVGIDIAAVDLGQPREHLSQSRRSERGQDPVAPGPERERELGGFHDPLVTVADIAPVPRPGRVGAIDQAAHDKVEHVERVAAVLEEDGVAWVGQPGAPRHRHPAEALHAGDAVGRIGTGQSRPGG